MPLVGPSHSLSQLNGTLSCRYGTPEADSLVLTTHYYAVSGPTHSLSQLNGTLSCRYGTPEADSLVLTAHYHAVRGLHTLALSP
ncbi:hypothetical protein PCURB6_15860 [Paenibacillus curdlanolyticus]|nr:hypothetical protein PCURB6_15860 [Paenibacillus curdlanolyticus]